MTEHYYTHDPRDAEWMQMAIEQAHLSHPVEKAYCVGAVLVKNNTLLATGYSRELPGNTHAEQCAIMKVPNQEDLRGATIYTTMEPCSTRLSGNKPCTERILEAGITRVVMGVKEPPNLVAACQGVQILRAAGVQVQVVPGVEEACLAPNQHILKSSLSS